MGDINLDAVTLEDVMFLYEQYHVTCLIMNGHLTELISAN